LEEIHEPAAVGHGGFDLIGCQVQNAGQSRQFAAKVGVPDDLIILRVGVLVAFFHVFCVLLVLCRLTDGISKNGCRPAFQREPPQNWGKKAVAAGKKRKFKQKRRFLAENRAKPAVAGSKAVVPFAEVTVTFPEVAATFGKATVTLRKGATGLGKVTTTFEKGTAAWAGAVAAFAPAPETGRQEELEKLHPIRPRRPLLATANHDRQSKVRAKNRSTISTDSISLAPTAS
jgi:hypothetical protein